MTAGKDAGKQIRLREFQKAYIRAVYDKQVDGRRVVRTALLTMARKNGKTELIAALCLAHLCSTALAELNGQIYSAAADREQAALVFNAAAAMVRMDPDLSSELNIIDSRKRIVHFASGSFYQAISSESKTKHGFNASVVLYDELAQAPNRELYDVLTTSMGAREQPLCWIISTMSADATHLMTELVDYGRKVAAGEIDDPTFLAFIHEVPRDADPWDEKNWYLANPALDDFRSLDEMRITAARARRMPSAESTFRNLYLNQAVDAAQAWIGRGDWQRCEATIDLEDYRGRECWGGLDLSGKNDLTAFVLTFADEAGYEAVPMFWTPAEGLQDREDRDRVPYVLWHKQGHIETTPGRSVDYEAVAMRIMQVRAKFNLRAIAFDRWRIDDLHRELEALGCSVEITDPGKPPETGADIVLVKHGQGYRDMSPAVEALETAVLNGELRVQKNPVMTMCSANAVLTMDPAGSRKFDKMRSTGRIDGIVALAMSVRCAIAFAAPVEEYAVGRLVAL